MAEENGPGLLLTGPPRRACVGQCPFGTRALRGCQGVCKPALGLAEGRCPRTAQSISKARADAGRWPCRAGHAAIASAAGWSLADGHLCGPCACIHKAYAGDHAHRLRRLPIRFPLIQARAGGEGLPRAGQWADQPLRSLHVLGTRGATTVACQHHSPRDRVVLTSLCTLLNPTERRCAAMPHLTPHSPKQVRPALGRPRGVAHDGAALKLARRRKVARRLCILAVEVDARWNEDSQRVVKHIVRLRNRRVPALRASAA